MNTSRILYLIGQLGPGGAERQLVFLLQAIDRQQYRPAVAVWNYRPDETYVSQIAALGVPLYPMPASSVPAKLLSLRRCVRRLRPEVVHSYTFFTNIAAYLGAVGTSAVVVGAIQGDYIEDMKSCGPLRGSLNVRWPRTQILNSHLAFQNAGAAPGLLRPRCAKVVRNGLDLNRFAPRGDRSPTAVPVVLGIGSLLPVKRWDRLLEAAANLKANGLNFAVEIAGEGPMRSDLESRARQLDIADRVRLWGYVARVEERLRAASVLVHTSDSEGCPNAVIEAMAAGLPVVATDSGDVPNLIEHGKTGFVVRRGDDGALAEHLGRLVTNDVMCREMGRRARLKAEREFDLERLASETLDVYRAAGWMDLN